MWPWMLAVALDVSRAIRTSMRWSCSNNNNMEDREKAKGIDELQRNRVTGY